MNPRDDIIDRLQELNLQRGALYKELERSLALKDLWPEVFNGYGKVTTQRVDAPTGRFAYLKVKAANGETREFAEVPDILKYASPPPE